MIIYTKKQSTIQVYPSNTKGRLSNIKQAKEVTTDREAILSISPEH
jgi:hypothetical protein